MEPASKQREQMQKLLDDQQDRLVNLAGDIVENGISPIDIALVMPSKVENNKFVVLEGNRRLLALKILSNPHMLGDMTVPDGRRKKLEKLATRFKDNPIKAMVCYEVESREKARHWLLLRHIGAGDGSGVVGWSGVATARFRGEDSALQALEFLLKSGQLNAEEVALLSSMRFPITTLRRLLESRGVKDFLGIEVKEEKLLSGLPADELLKPLKRIALDLARGDVTVTDVKLKEQQLAYVNKFPASDRPNLKKVGSMRPVQDITAGDFGKKDGGNGKKERKKKNVSPDRATVVPRAHRLPISDTKANEIYHELRKLNVENTAHACAVLIRVFLEHTTDRYCEHAKIPLRVDRNGHKVDKSLAKKVEEAVDHLIAAGAAKKGAFYSLRRGIGQDHSPLSATLLNAYVHNAFTKPSPRELRNAWDFAQPFFDKVWEILGE